MNVPKLIQKKPEERIKYTLRRHPVTFVYIILFFLLLITIPVGLYFFFNNLFPELLESEVVFTIFILFSSIYYLSIYTFFFSKFIDFYLDLWVITTERVVDIEQYGLFSRSVSELDLYRIQDVTTKINGVLPTIFQYGDIHIKTASQNVEIIFKNVPEPPEIRRHIIHLADLQENKEKNLESNKKKA